MAIGEYDYKLTSTRNICTGNSRNSISAALERLSLPLSEDTVRNYLTEAAKALSYKEPVKT